MKRKNKDFNIDMAEDSSGFLLWQVTTLWQRGIKKALAKEGITHPQFVLLASLLWLSKQKETVTQIDLSSHSKIDPMTTSGILRILHKKQLIERQEHQTDTRAKSITLTDKGKKMTKQAMQIIEKFDGKFFRALGKETKKFNGSLLTILKAKQK